MNFAGYQLQWVHKSWLAPESRGVWRVMISALLLSFTGLILNGCNNDEVGTLELISPENNAILDNGCYTVPNSIEWFFDWSDYPGAQKYHLYVIRSQAPIPVINNDNIDPSEYTYYTYGYILESNRFGWTWKVRAMVKGVWTDWTEIRIFDVEPMDTDCP